MRMTTLYPFETAKRNSGKSWTPPETLTFMDGSEIDTVAGVKKKIAPIVGIDGQITYRFRFEEGFDIYMAVMLTKPDFWHNETITVHNYRNRKFQYWCQQLIKSLDNQGADMYVLKKIWNRLFTTYKIAGYGLEQHIIEHDTPLSEILKNAQWSLDWLYIFSDFMTELEKCCSGKTIRYVPMSFPAYRNRFSRHDAPSTRKLFFIDPQTKP